MTDSSQEASPPPEHLPARSVQNRGSTVSMTSTTTGLPDRYRPIDQVGPDEPTPTGVIQCWRAKDRVLNQAERQQATVRTLELDLHAYGVAPAVYRHNAFATVRPQ